MNECQPASQLEWVREKKQDWEPFRCHYNVSHIVKMCLLLHYIRHSCARIRIVYILFRCVWNHFVSVSVCACARPFGKAIKREKFFFHSCTHTLSFSFIHSLFSGVKNSIAFFSLPRGGKWKNVIKCGANFQPAAQLYANTR